MSAYVNEKGLQPPPPKSGMLDQISELLQTAQKLDTALKEERAKSERLSTELRVRQEKADGVIAEERARNLELRTREQKYRAALAGHQSHTNEQTEQLRRASLEVAQTKTELQKYQQSWGMVLEREREAKSIIQESIERGKRLAEAEDRHRKIAEELIEERKLREQADRHAKSYQAELQNALVRLHSAESRYGELTKELQAHNESKKTVDQERKKLEESLKERFQWDLAREKERLKSELQRSSTIETETLREEIRQGVFAEYERRMNAEREHAAKISRLQLEEIGRLKGEIEVLRKRTASTIQALPQEADQTAKRYKELGAKMDALRKEASQVKRAAEPMTAPAPQAPAQDWLPDPLAKASSRAIAQKVATPPPPPSFLLQK